MDERKLCATGADTALASVMHKARQLRIAYELLPSDELTRLHLWVNAITAEHDALIAFMDESGVEYEQIYD